MVSVCMATKNGERYIGDQLESILQQLAPGDELIVSDDHSTDNTLRIIQSFGDPRVKLYKSNTSVGVIKNFETSLWLSKGEYIFLADQDDIWLPNKYDTMMKHLKLYDLVISDCLVVDHMLRLQVHSFFTFNNSGKGLIKNLWKNSYMGCCMAFSRTLLQHALPFPKDIPIHDFWIGLIGELYFDVCFIPEALVYHRRHQSNASTTGEISSLSLQKKLSHRYRIVKNLILHKAYAR